MNPRLASIALAVLFLVSPLLVSPMAASSGALLLDGEGPWRNSRWQLGVSEFRSLLEEAGYQVRIISPADLAKQVSGTAGRVAIAVPSLERLPISAFRTIAGRIQRGDILLASGGEAFREPLYRAPGGKWVALEELLSQAPRTPLLEPGRARLRSPSRPPEGVVTRKRIAGPDGKLDSLELRINQPVRLALEESEPFTQSPFATGQSTTIVTVKGTAEEMLAVEWREADGTRWRARVPLTPEWRTHILRPSNFELPPNASPGGDKKRFDPSRVRVFAFGPAGEVNTPASGSVEYAIGPVTLGSNPQAEDFEIPHIETISPWYKQYESVRDGERVLVPIARPRGLTAAPEPDGRYEAIGNLLDPAATRYLTSTGAAVFWLPWPQLSGKHRGELVELLRRTSHGLALLNGGAGVFAVDPGRRVDLGARVYNASPRAVTANLTWAVLRGDQQLLVRSAAARIPASQMRDVSVGGAVDLPPGEYRVETVVRAGKAVCDQGNGYLRVTDPRARTAGERLRVRDGHFFAGEKPVFLNGVNYWPRNVAGLEPARYWDHWLTPRNYDPEIVEADLAALEALGMNWVSIQYNRTEQGPPLMDFLERCRRHGIRAHLSISSAVNLQLDPGRDQALVEAAHLAGNSAVFAYEIAWEPHFGQHEARTSFDEAWRSWVADQYGSVTAAARAWGVDAPRDEQGRLTNPSDRQITTDGSHRVLVAAYRRFLDDLVSRAYGRAIRHLKSLDPGALFAVRTGWGGTGQPGNNRSMGYDLLAGAAHLDATSAEGYGMAADFPQARKLGFITAYGRYAGGGKPVLWLEFGASIGSRYGTRRMLANQTSLCDTMMRVVADSGADGTAVWWYPGGWRVNEQSDFGIMNIDGSPRESARVLSEWGMKLASALTVKSAPLQSWFSGGTPASGQPLTLTIDRDADARGLAGLWERLEASYVKAREAGRPVRLVSPGSGTDTGSMPMVQVGNVPYSGSGPLKYANAEIAGIRVKWPGGELAVENGGELELPRDTELEIQVSLVNTGEAAWIPAGTLGWVGGCALRSSAGEAKVRERVERYGRTTAGSLSVMLRQEAIELTGRLEAKDRGAFGETLRLRLRPGKSPQGNKRPI